MTDNTTMETNNNDDLLQKAKSVASNPRHLNSDRPREEGELSSSDDDENHVSSRKDSVAASPVTASPSKRIAAQSQGNAIPRNASEAQFQQKLKPEHDKSQVPLRSSSPAWHRPSAASDNLVISFSDDDSGSESEGDRRQKDLEIKCGLNGMNGNVRAPSLSYAQSGKWHQNAKNVNKMTGKRPSMSRTFISATTKANGGINSRVSVPKLVEQGSRPRKFNIRSNLLSQESGFDHGIGLSSNKLQDLRQQIALRERELKLKATQIQQNKEPIPVPRRDCHNSLNLSGDLIGKSNLSSVDVGRLDPKEPQRKRLKVGGSYSTQISSDGRWEVSAVKSTSTSKDRALENDPTEERNTISHIKDGSQTSIVELQKKYDKQKNISSENIPSATICRTSSPFDYSSAQVDPFVTSNLTASQNVIGKNLTKNIRSVGLNNSVDVGLLMSTSDHTVMHSRESYDGISGRKKFEQSPNNCQVSHDNIGQWNCLAMGNAVEPGNMDIQSLAEMEESLDKELEEAQELRRKCEIEERNALKAYRKAQRALMEANARCTELYRGREVYSAHLRSLLMSNSGFLWSSRPQEHTEIGLIPAKNLIKNHNAINKSGHRMPPEHNDYNQPESNSNTRSTALALNDASFPPVNEQLMGSQPCSEQDASTSEPLGRTRKTAADGARSVFTDPNTSADEDEETFPLEHNITIKNQQKQQCSVIRQNDVHHNKNLSTESQDSLTLEATLRSELFARLGKRSLKNTNSSNIEPTDDIGTENDNGSERTQTSNCSIPLLQAENNQEENLRGNCEPERSISENPIQTRIDQISNFHPVTDTEDDIYSMAIVDHQITILESALSYMKLMFPVKQGGLQQENSQEVSCNEPDNDVSCRNSEESLWNYMLELTMDESFGDVHGRGIGLFTISSPVDPFWPLCMFELRGKCNNDECPWQHLRDFSNNSLLQHQHDDSATVDWQTGLKMQQKSNGKAKFCKGHNVLPPPTYIVSLDTLKASPTSQECIIAQRKGQCWHKCFSVFLAVSDYFQKDISIPKVFSLYSGGRIEVHGLNSHLSYFRSRNNKVNQLNQVFDGNVQPLERALLILGQESNKEDGAKRALSVLSRAIEADPMCEILWIIYLLIYYSLNSIEKVDMFYYAVRHSDRSYALWLMYINSRMCLDDRLVAYTDAVTALCCRASTSDMNTSACILDLTLQMMECLCMSGDSEKAIQKIYGLFPVTASSDEPHSLLLSDILTCLTISDKYIFWVCCIYLVIYRKLPDAIVQRFECEKELHEVEWPSARLREEEKQRVVKLVELVVSSLKFCVDGEMLEGGPYLKAAEHFSLCHIRCMMAIDGIACCWNLLDRYVKLYPSCLDLVVLSAKVKSNDSEDLNLTGFEEALSGWPKDVPGIHCIWNQYICYALQKGGPDFAKEIATRWLTSYATIQHNENGTSDSIKTNRADGAAKTDSESNVDFWIPSSNQMDIMFGYLNLSLAKLFKNDYLAARSAVDIACKSAAPQFINHCLREHATFLNYELQLKDAPISKKVKILNDYLDQAWAYATTVPLSKKFMGSIEKSRVKELVGSLLAPPSDFSLVNSILEVWHGPNLLPENLNPLKHWVDFVEAILEVVPSNYPLAMCACRMLSRSNKSADGSIMFWTSSILVNTLLHAIPVAPEYVWVDAAGILGDIAVADSNLEKFFKRALLIYPFSVKLWNCYYSKSKKRKWDTSCLVKHARDRGIELGEVLSEKDI